MADGAIIRSLDDPAFDTLCKRLSALAADLERSGRWPGEQLQICAEHGVFSWFQSPAWGGQEWSEVDLLRAYLRLSAACLTTTFIITQRSGAVGRIASSENETPQRRWLEALAVGRAFATVGISHLTTSRRHLARPVLEASESARGFKLEGSSPWVTGGAHADVIVTGATLPDGRQILAAVPADLPGVEAVAPQSLVGLTASHTGEVRFHAVEIEHDMVLAGPVENVMKIGRGAGTGGLQTSALAIGHASAAIAYLEAESGRRPELGSPSAELRDEQQSLEQDLIALAVGAGGCSPDQLRARANSLTLRASQAALAAAKGAGYVVGHPAGRWCREALFFLVWSCPQPVVAANLCELAGLE